MDLNIQTALHKGQAVKVALDGSLDSDTAPKLSAELDNVLQGDTNALVFDMTNLSFISSAGLRVIFKAQKEINAKSGKIMMINLQPQVKKVFEIVKALPSLAVFRSWEEMDEYLEHMQKEELRKNP